MSPLKSSNNLAARMGRWSASHWKTAVFGWLLFVVVAFMIGTKVPTKTIDQNDSNVGQSHKADQILKNAFPETNAQSEVVLIQSPTKTVSDPAFRAAVEDVTRTVGGNLAIKNLKSPLDPANKSLVSDDRRSVMVTWDMKGTYDQAKKKIDSFTAAVDGVGERHPGFYVGEAGAVSSGKALDKMFTDQLKTAGERSIPITIIVLLLVFGALVAVGVPLLLALSSVLITVFLTALPSHLIPMDQNVDAVILLIGLAVGVDYSLFYLKREREERAAGRGSRAAIEAAAAAGALVVLALPTLHIHTAESGMDALPNSAPTVTTIKKITNAFSGGTVSPADVAIKADTTKPEVQRAIAAIQSQVVAHHLNKGSIDVETNPSHTVARISIPLVGKGTDSASNAALDTLRNQILPSTIGTVEGAQWAVTGQTANSADENA